MAEPVHLSIVLPVYNGEARLRQTLEQVHALIQRLRRPCEVLAVNDGSSDGTAQILQAWGTSHPELRLLAHEQNRGKGAALKTAVAASLGELVLTVDADATYSLDEAETFLDPLMAGAGAAIANRRDPETRFLLHPRDFAYVGRRHLIGGIFGWISRRMLGLHVSDIQAGFKAYRGEVARELFPQVEADRFAFDLEILALLELSNQRVVELPVVLVYRHQPSTVKLFRDGGRMLGRLWSVRAKVKRLRRSGVLANRFAKNYQHHAREHGHPVQRFWHTQKWPMVEDQLDFLPTDRVLEVGAGSSDIPTRTAERVRFSCATDRDPATMDYLAGLAAEGGVGVRCVAADITALPFLTGAFQKVVALEVIEHLPEDTIDTYMSELRRMLAPGGQLLLTTPNYRSTWPLFEWIVDCFGGGAEMGGGAQHICRFHPRRLREALERNGFAIETFGSVYHGSPFLNLLAPRLAEKLFRWELRSGGSWGPILFARSSAR